MSQLKLLVDTVALAGEIMLSSGAETYRVEDTMYHMLNTAECETKEALALLTGIFVTVNDKSLDQPLTIMKTVNNRVTNMSNIMKVNELSRAYCGGKITLEETFEKLKNVRGKQYSRLLYNLATVGIAVGFTMMFGGKGLELFLTTIVAGILAGIITLGKIMKWSGIFVNALGGMEIALIAMLARGVLPTLDADVVIVGAIMPIVPGVAITNAIRDTIQADYLSGGGRVLEAFLTAASVAVGIGLGMVAANAILGGAL